MNKTSNKILSNKSNSNIQNMIVRKMRKVVNKIRIIIQVNKSRVVSKYMRMSRLLQTKTTFKEF